MFDKVLRVTALGAIVVLGTQPAWALDADQFGARLKGAVELLGISIDYDSASVSGDTVTLSDFTIFIPGEDEARVPGDVVFSGVAETADGGFTIETATTADLEIDDPEENLSLSLRNVAMEGITLPGSIEEGNLVPAVMDLYRSISAGPLTVRQDGSEVFGIRRFSTTIESPADNGDIVSRLAVEGISADLSAVPDAEAQEITAALGIERFSAVLTANSTWNPETSRAGVSDFTFAVKGLGSVTMDGTLTGFDRAFVEDLMALNLQMARLAQQDEEVLESEIARIEQTMLDRSAKTGIEGFSIRYDDESLFMKALDIAAAEQGIDGQTLATGLKFMVSMGLAELPDAAFKAMATTQINAFIDDPRNLTVSAEPDAPVDIAALENAEEDPLALIELFNIIIKANQ